MNTSRPFANRCFSISIFGTAAREVSVGAAPQTDTSKTTTKRLYARFTRTPLIVEEFRKRITEDMNVFEHKSSEGFPNSRHPGQHTRRDAVLRADTRANQRRLRKG